MTKAFSIIKANPLKCALLFIWFVLISVQTDTLLLLYDYVAFVFLGMLGAIFANSTGAGGGVVFVPLFNQLSLSNETIIATSFAIQCCGMTAGALTWHKYYRVHQSSNPQWNMLHKGLLITVPCSIGALLIAQFVFGRYTDTVQSSLHLYFGMFSIVLAIAIYASIPLMSRIDFVKQFGKSDLWFLMVISFSGGIVTAWLSVGVGELVAVYLILRGFNITFAIALAVILSAFTVWSAIGYHVFVSQAIYWEIVLFAGAGAIIGGMIAKYVVLFFSPVRLKMFFASWVLVMGVLGLPLFA